jgi:glycine cleavage system H protein
MCPENLQYTKKHEWIRLEDKSALIGITDYAQEQLGDVVYVELPDVGAQLTQFEVCGTIESVKTVSDLYAPLSGEVLRVNEALDETPELINNEPYGAGWIAEIHVSDQGELDNLLSAEEYEVLIREES